MGMVCYDEVDSHGMSSAVLIETAVLTAFVTTIFFISKTTYDRIRRSRARATVHIIGAGPIGLMSALIAVRSKKASRIVIQEERSRKELLNANQQVALDGRSVAFLHTVGVDFDNIEGCWKHRSFFTRLGVFEEYMLTKVEQLDVPIEIRFNSKFNRESLKDLEAIQGRLIVIACDGSTGRAATLLGLSDEIVHQSCRAYGACAAIERYHQRSVPTPETRVHNLTFDLDAYDNGSWGWGNGGGGGWTSGGCSPCPERGELMPPQGFHLKLFGSVRHRYMALAVPKCESRLVRTLKVALDQSIMRNIFQVCFNTYKTDCEPDISDIESIKNLKFSPRLFEIKLAQRMETVGFIQDTNMFVVSEGEAARVLNFHSGSDINLAVRGLYSLEHFLRLGTAAESETCLMHALMYKHNHTKALVADFVKNGLKEGMYT